MDLTFFGKDPNSKLEDCPSVWVDDATADLVFQGWKADKATEAECLKVGSIPDHEGVFRIPASMVDQIRKALDVAEERARVL
ncbi:hypothetical protein [Streptomyces sp. NPDC090022]|uniref:hypothetical protein n=1 Tax=Streptomyces sp. NPDC090022 TaxID=3365920 RepID=UPI003800CBF8